MGKVVDGNFLHAFAAKRVFVTGHTGFKGSWLTFLLNEIGADVLGYALPPEQPFSHFTSLELTRFIRHVEGDVRDEAKLVSTMKEFQPEFVFHLAAQALVRISYAAPRSTFETNFMGSVNLFEAVRQCESVRSLVCITSDKCYENVEWVWGYRENDRLGGHDPYSASKAAAEIAFAAYARSFFDHRSKLGAATARAGNVIGGGDWAPDRIVPDCVQAVRSGHPIRLRNPDSTRPWQHVLEPLSGYLLLATRLRQAPALNSGAWNFGPSTGDVMTVREVAERIIAGLGRGSITIATGDPTQREAKLLQLNCDKAQQLLGWRPRWSTEQTLAATVAWYKSVLDGADAASITRQQVHHYFPELS